MGSPHAVGIPLRELALRCGAELAGDGEVVIDRVAALDRAGQGAIAFLSDPKYRSHLAGTLASAVIVAPADAPATSLPKLLAENPYATYARVAAILHPRHAPPPAIHPTAVIAADARVAATAAVGAHAVIGARASVGERTEVGAGTVIGEDATRRRRLRAARPRRGLSALGHRRAQHHSQRRGHRCRRFRHGRA